jgi:hypothetical protein
MPAAGSCFNVYAPPPTPAMTFKPSDNTACAGYDQPPVYRT